jgi:serine/threonine protein kinase
VFDNLVLLVQRAVQHLLANDLIHGDIKDDQFFLTAEGSVVLGDFGTAWKLVDEDGVAQRLGGRDELMTRRCEPAGAARVPRLVPCDCAERERRGPFHSPQLSAESGSGGRAGVGHYKAPEVRGRARADDHPLLRDVYSKAEGFSVGILMCDLLGVLRDGDVFDRLSDTHLAEERLAERGMPPSRPDDPMCVTHLHLSLDYGSRVHLRTAGCAGTGEDSRAGYTPVPRSPLCQRAALAGSAKWCWVCCALIIVRRSGG